MSDEKVSPYKPEITVWYTCPKCGLPWAWTIQQIRAMRWRFPCECGRLIRTKPILGIQFHFPQNQSLTFHESKIPSKRKKPTVPVEVINALVNLGYRRSNARRIVGDYVRDGKYSGDSETLVTQILQETNPDEH